MSRSVATLFPFDIVGAVDVALFCITAGAILCFLSMPVLRMQREHKNIQIVIYMF